jgi:hypothetical protein
MPAPWHRRRGAVSLAAGGTATAVLLTGALWAAGGRGTEPAMSVHVAAGARVAAPAVVDPTRPEAAALEPATGVDWRADATIWAAVVRARVDDTRRAAATRQVAKQRAEAAYQAARDTANRVAAAPAAPTTSTPLTGSVWVVGDSIAAGLGQAWPGSPSVITQPEARTAAVLPHVTSALAAGAAPHVLVVASGTNDDPADPDAFRTQVQHLLGATGGCVVWTTVHRPGGRWQSLNAVLAEQAAAAAGRLQLADWGRLATSNPELLQSDGIHPRSGTVYSRIVALATAAAARCPR